jgi:hypothetical protein
VLDLEYEVQTQAFLTEKIGFKWYIVVVRISVKVALDDMAE